MAFEELLSNSCGIVTRLVALLVLAQACGGTRDEYSNRTPLHFLNLLPFPDSRPMAGWDRAYELLPAAELAMEHVNNASNLLPNYTLNLVTIESEPCGISTINNGLVYSYAEVFDQSRSLNVIGMGGLFCSTVTNTITGVFSSPNVTFLQLAGSTIPAHRNSTRYPWLVHLTPSVSAINDAIVALMKVFNWRRISVIYDWSGFFPVSAALDFTTRAGDLGVEIVSTMSISEDIFQILATSRSRIVYIFAQDSLKAFVLCQAYQNRAVYPGFVYIFHETSAAQITAKAGSTECTAAELLSALEGAFIIKHKVVADNDDVLVSNLRYHEYYQKYVLRVQEIESSKGISLEKTNVYANVMYDQVWAFALALNASLEKFKARNIDLKDLELLQSPFIADTLRREIRSVSFQGASGYISFDSSNDRKSLELVFQVIGGKEKLIGEYYSVSNYASCLGNEFGNNVSNATLCLFNSHAKLPSDSFETKMLLSPLWVSTLINIIIGAFVVETTVTLVVLYVIFRKRPEVKASSISLSIVIFIGCYSTYVSAFASNANRSYAISSSGVFTMACNIDIWFGSLGMTLVFSALFMRLLRVQQIFKAYGKLTRFWSDKYLILSVLAICAGNSTILILWTVLDTSKRVTITQYKSASIPPHFEVLSRCYSKHSWTWFVLIMLYIGILMSLIVFMAVQTRKIKLSNFKDTKKINLFITATCVTYVTAVPVWLVLNLVAETFVPGHFISIVVLICAGVYCQIFLFLPLVVKVVRKVCNEKRSPKPTTADIIKQYQIRERQYSKIL